jgi:iron complex transport system permease protein
MGDSRRIRRIFTVLGCVIVLAVAVYLYARVLGKSLDTGLPLTAGIAKRIATGSAVSIVGMMVSATLIAVVSLAFQTITENRVLTPSMVGFDSVFIATQSVLVFLAGRWALSKALFSNPYYNFLVATGMMLLVSLLMYGIILRRNRNNIVFLLLFGLILSGMVRSLTNYLEVLLNPQEFQQLQAATNVTITNMNEGIILLATPLMLVITFLFVRRSREYDVMLLGMSGAKGLGVPYTRRLNLSLILIALAMAVTTALIGPLTFLGLLAVNIARELFRTYRHSVLFIGSILTAIVFLVLGQGIVELLRYATPVTVLIDLVGGSYMVWLILKVGKL